MTPVNAQKIDRLKDWFRKRNPNVDIGSIDLDADLVAARVLNSLEFLDFVYFLEELRGKEIEMGSLNLNAFRTLRLVHDGFLNTTSSGANNS